MKSPSSLIIVVLLGLTMVGASYFAVCMHINTPNNANQSIAVLEVSEGVSISRVSTTWPSKYLESLDFARIGSESDLVALVRIAGPIMSYDDGKHYPFTLYRSTVVDCLKGRLSESGINVIQYGGYFKSSFILNEGIPLMEKGEFWVLFMRKMDWEPSFRITLPENTYQVLPLTSLKYDGDRVETPRESEAILPETLHVHGMTMEQFKNLLGRP